MGQVTDLTNPGCDRASMEDSGRKPRSVLEEDLLVSSSGEDEETKRVNEKRVDEMKNTISEILNQNKQRKLSEQRSN